ncbi:MAG: TIGR03560 family F420-dependent LLM class oxidoreductase [Chloroflexi bacterium]|nr:TIGR03560 family F420-dependent LLM class oxidoreductase [Chloroflexota bacterium]
MAHPVRVGICIDQNLSWPEYRDRAQLVERLGYDSLWDCDHFIQPSRPDGPYLEGWTLLAGLAAATERIRLGVLVSSNTFRHPALLAKEAVTVDHISGGRLDIGLGAGWYVPEHDKFGLAFPPPAERVDRFREAVELVDLLLRQEITTYHGRYYQVTDAPFRPAPLQWPRPPLMLGAHGPRMMRIVAQHADAWNSFGTVDEMRQRNQTLDEACAAIGRDPATIVRSLYGWASVMPADPWASPQGFLDAINPYREVGVNEFLIDAPDPAGFAVMEGVAIDILPTLRAPV